MDNGQWTMKNKELTMENGKWNARPDETLAERSGARIDDMAFEEFSPRRSPNCPLSIAHYPSIKNIIFDLGGVIVDLDIKPSILAFAQLGLTPKGITLEELSKNGIPRDWEMFRLMHAMDLGEMDAQTFINTLRPQCLPGTRDEAIRRAFNRIIRLPRHRLEWMRTLRRHYRTFLLSNIGQLHWDETRLQAQGHGIGMEECFDRMFLSYQLRMAKPDVAIFRHLIDETGIEPSETLYIDDLPDNIEAGRSVGLVAHKIDCNGLDTVLPQLFPDILKD